MTNAEDAKIESNLEKAVEAELARAVTPSSAPIRRLTPVTEPNGDQAKRWIEMGEKLHDQTADKVMQLHRRYDELHADVVVKLRELRVVQREIQSESERLALLRQRLGYGG